MNILFLDAYYEPETIAYTHLEKDLIQGLITAGHRIAVICPTPTRGINEEIKLQYRRKKKESQYGGKVKVTRFWAPQEGKNPVIRAFRYFWCNIRTYQKAVRHKSVDIVFANSTPPTQGALGGIVARKLSKKFQKKIPFIYNLQDIFPDSLVNTNMAKEGSFLWNIGRKLEDFTYKHANKIILIGKGFKRNVMAKGVPEEKIEIISNWIDLSCVQPIERKDNSLIFEFGLDPDKFLVVYAGNFGAAQGADVVLKAAEELIEYKDIQFVIFGGGAYFEDAKKCAEKLDNVIIHELLPQDRVSEVYSLGDIALITCKKGMGKAGLPSKTWSIMACNTPIIASFDLDSDLTDIIYESGAGTCIEPENEKALTEAILEEYQNRKENNFLNLRSYVEQTASKDVCLQNYIKVIKASL